MDRQAGPEPGADPGIVVVGAGLVGPVIAMYLARRRHGPVTVIEQHADPRQGSASGGRSLMVILSARGWRVLRELGLAEQVRALCVPLTGRCGHLPDGRTRFTPYSRDGLPIWAVERERLLHALLDAAQATAGLTLRFGQRVRAVDLDGPAILLGDSSGERWLPCRHLLGCDGARSAVRAAMTARGVREDVSTLELAYQEINLPLAGLDRRIMHYWPAGDALFGAFPVLSSPDLFAGSVFLRRYGAAPSYAAAAAGHELAGQFAALFPGLATRIPDLAEQLATKPVATVPLVRCDRWTWGGKVALVGDSCHAMAPFMGQGMNCAFEDARMLVSCLDETADWARALAAYERVRREDGNAIADISYEHYRTMSRLPAESSDEVAALAARLSDLFPDRFTSLYERCAFTEEGYASARANDRRLRSFARDLLHEHGSWLLKVPDSRLREYALPPVDPNTGLIKMLVDQDTGRSAVIVVMFRSRFSEHVDEEYGATEERLAKKVRELAGPDLVQVKNYQAEDGERLALVWWRDPATLDRWRNDEEHQAAQRLGKELWYSFYELSVTEVIRTSSSEDESAYPAA